MFMAVVLADGEVVAGAVEACGDAGFDDEDGESSVQAVTASSKAAAGTTRARARGRAGFTSSSCG
jgi:hypothetical protein